MPPADYIPLPPNVVPSSQAGQLADTPKLDALIGETVAIRALEWIGEKPPYEGVRLWLHVVKGETMTAKPQPFRAYTEAVLRVARQLADGSTERTCKLDTWPMYKVVKSGQSYALADV